ncbi:MAG: glycoside hydrolase family 130 protein, partial [Planctomycetota bacterium]
AFSDDLLNWFENTDAALNSGVDNDHLLLAPEQKWEEQKLGGAGVPIKTDEGWLMMYHAKDKECVYRCGLVLLDLNDPRKVIARTPDPVFEPETDVEKNGRVKNVVFPCAHIVVNDEVYIYYGASDEHICVATVGLQEMLDNVLKFKR